MADPETAPACPDLSVRPDPDQRGRLLRAPGWTDHEIAGVVLRNWWSARPEHVHARVGLRAPFGPGDPVVLPPEIGYAWWRELHTPTGDIIRLVILGGGSAIVLHAGPGQTAFQALPVVLRLDDLKMPDGADDTAVPDLSVTCQPGASRLTLHDGDDTLDIPLPESGPLGPGVLPDALSSRLDADMHFWARQIASWPLLHMPEDGHGIAPEGILGRRIARALDAPQGTAYVTPAFLPFDGLTTEQRTRISRFLDTLAEWLQRSRYPDAYALLIKLSAAPIRQAGQVLPRIDVTLIGSSKDTRMRTEPVISKCLETMMAQGAFPVSRRRMIGQREIQIPEMALSSLVGDTLHETTVGRRLPHRLSRHAMLAAEARWADFFPKSGG